MTAVIDTTSIAKSFSNAAQTYDAWALPQTFVAKKLCSLLPQNARHILDLGCGTGLMTDLVRQQYPAAFITGVDPAEGMIQQCKKRFASDTRTTFILTTAERYVSSCSFDLIVATCSMHWFSDKQKAVSNIRSSLMCGGKVGVAIPIQGSLPELYASYQAVMGAEMPGVKLLPAKSYSTIFSEAGLFVEHAIVEEVRMTVPDSLFVIDSLRCIGGAPKGLSFESPLPDNQLEEILAFYNSHFATENGVDFTYQFLFGIASKYDEH
jgi:malonyl-CoA O-methyltransferase